MISHERNGHKTLGFQGMEVLLKGLVQCVTPTVTDEDFEMHVMEHFTFEEQETLR